jgi:antitoxin component of RelBE/YafQ-DinJ toxin-antitoxin module
MKADKRDLVFRFRINRVERTRLERLAKRFDLSMSSVLRMLLKRADDESKQRRRT